MKERTSPLQQGPKWKRKERNKEKDKPSACGVEQDDGENASQLDYYKPTCRPTIPNGFWYKIRITPNRLLDTVIFANGETAFCGRTRRRDFNENQGD